MRAGFVVPTVALALLACNGLPPTPDVRDASPVDASGDVVPTVDTGVDVDLHDGLLLPRCEDTEPTGDPGIAPVASTLIGTIQPVAMRFAMADTANNTVFERAELRYRAMGLDQYVRGAAQPRVQRTDLGGTVDTTLTRHSIAWFVHLSDTQLVDDESPTRLALLEAPENSGGIRPQEAYVARAISAMNRTLTALERPQRPYQFGLFAGDCSDSAQTNELTWFMQVMNGAVVHTDSGANDDPVPGPDNDPKDPFTSVPFPAPWYFVPGNHDLEVVGIGTVSASSRAMALADYNSTGTRNYATWWAEPRRGAVVPDPQRALLAREDIVHALQTDTAVPGPAGHGFPSGTVDTSVGANYATDVIPNLLRVLAMDTSNDTGGSDGLVHRSTVDQFLRPQLDRAQRDGVLVAMASHHPASTIKTHAGQVGNTIADAVDGSEIASLVASYPNVIAWFVGHEHLVSVRAIRGADAMHPGYWEIESGSVADWPSQARTIELVNNGNGTLSWFGTMVDFEPQSCMERRYRRLALMDFLDGWSPDLRGTDQDRNVELVIPVPATAAANVAAATATSPTRIESETTLRGVR